MPPHNPSPESAQNAAPITNPSNPTPPTAAPAPSNPTRFYTLIGAGVLAILALAAFLFIPGLKAVDVPQEPLKVGMIQNVKHLDLVIDGFKQGLTEYGYIEGEDVIYTYQNADGDMAKVEAFTKQYIADDVDLIVAVTEQAAKVVWATTEAAGVEIPIVFTNGLGMVETGFLDSYASSGTYMTGVVPDDVDVTIKKLEFLKQINPNAKKVGVFYSSLVPIYPATASREALQEQAPKLGLEIVEYDVKSPPGPGSTAVMQAVADTIQPGDIDAIVTIPEVVTNFQDNPKILLELSKRIKAPILFLTVPRVYEGGLLSYSQDYMVFGKQAARQASKIFSGTHPSEIPIEFSERNHLIINLKTATELGLTIPQSLLYIADEVIPAE